MGHLVTSLLLLLLLLLPLMLPEEGRDGAAKGTMKCRMASAQCKIIIMQASSARFVANLKSGKVEQKAGLGFLILRTGQTATAMKISTTTMETDLKAMPSLLLNTTPIVKLMLPPVAIIRMIASIMILRWSSSTIVI